MDEVKTLEENVTTNGEGSANLAKNGEIEPQIQISGIEEKVSTDPKPLDSPIDDRLTPSPEPVIQQTEENLNDAFSGREPEPEPESKPNDLSSEKSEDSPKGQDHVQNDVISSVGPRVEEDVISRKPKPEANGNGNASNSLKRVQIRKSPLGPSNGKVHNHEKASPKEVSPKTVSPKKVSPKTVSPKKVSPKTDKGGSEKQLEKSPIKIGDIDTTAPFESVKAAVSMFAEIVDWKAHKIRIQERRKYVQQELRKVNEEIPVFKKKAEAAEEEKRQVLKELDNTKRLVEELKLNLERTQTEERQANQDAELAKLRVEEMEQGVSDDSSVAAKAQLEVAQARHQAAVAELKSVKNELENLQKDYDLLLTERDIAVKNAEEAVSNLKEIEKTVEGLTIKLIATKDALESVHAAHLEAEEQRIGVAMARDQDALNWEKELKRAQEELEMVNRQIISTEELKSKLDTASVLLQDLKIELAAYMGEEKETDEPGKTKNDTHTDIQSAASLAKANLEEVKKEIEKATEDVNRLKLEATSLNAELEKEKAMLLAIRRTEGMASVTVASLEAELKTTTCELDLIRRKEKEARERMADLPKQLRAAAEEADRAKSLTITAREELEKAKEAADQAKAGASRMTTRLNATQKDIEAARASERLALGAISALHESESARVSKSETETGVTISLEEYYELSRKAQQAEDEANKRVTEAISQIDVAKESEMKAIAKLGQINTELASKKEELSIAMQKAEKAKEGKLAVEQELRTWRSDHEQKRKAQDDGGQRGVVHGSNPKGSSDVQPPSHNHKPDAKPETNNNGTESSRETKPKKKKRRSFFRFFMFFRKKHSNKST
ncbi:hypothetical protein OSB04_003059 [Centaurea solstitialis]|uniref:Uncharacterized protein n=1 Tax=Centaurea solstitialis TaxID=347529 RepID=A0AA38U1N3_9ASTR|nr:hypothetical protein OSB04_003059 [Centaurea solstitialis]